eukprot:CAMPEP_0175997170 /NCGR_PEP_ID=MMETSP0108-20121206/56060_1 /TAXON_ID=195067 ORGANISM="Goniomonas pacifica, Strain CCMP1869" /NCGR_SAMPLE_ID=MMETSP0108 /ASSEMBLY_ACC=CAM_ASM_000204 /LENGTH=182 /DNA_ID=CAMNT_0017329417 /DNA_START=31 /DNA_END=581 /DNA_ORIENTATION=-
MPSVSVGDEASEIFRMERECPPCLLAAVSLPCHLLSCPPVTVFSAEGGVQAAENVRHERVNLARAVMEQRHSDAPPGRFDMVPPPKGDVQHVPGFDQHIVDVCVLKQGKPGKVGISGVDAAVVGSLLHGGGDARNAHALHTAQRYHIAQANDLPNDRTLVHETPSTRSTPWLDTDTHAPEVK